MTARLDGTLEVPRNVEAEAALLGALMIDNRLTDGVGALEEAHFYDPLHGRIFAAIVRFVRGGGKATPVTLRPLFDADPGMIELGGVSYLASLTGSGAGLIGARQFAAQIVDLARLRAIAEAGQAIAARALDTSEEVSPEARLEEAEALLSELASFRNSTAAPVSFGSAIAMAAAAVRDVSEGKRTLGVKVEGLPEWNEAVGGGVPAGDLVYLAGRPSMGKTVLALRVARGAARAGHGVLFISREMKVLPIAMRMLADLMFEAGSPLTMDDLKHGRASKADFRLMAELGADADTLPLVFEEPATLNVGSIAPMIRRHARAMEKRGQKLELVVIDYVGLLDPAKGRGNREQEISDISRALKAAALSTSVGIVALSQLSRAVEQREDKRPQLSDLRDSGSLEADADAVIFVYRAQYYLERAEPPAGDNRRSQWEMDLEAARDRLSMISAKVRQGSIGTRQCWYFGEHQAVRSDALYRDGGGHL